MATSEEIDRQIAQHAHESQLAVMLCCEAGRHSPADYDWALGIVRQGRKKFLKELDKIQKKKEKAGVSPERYARERDPRMSGFERDIR